MSNENENVRFCRRLFKGSIWYVFGVVMLGMVLLAKPVVCSDRQIPESGRVVVPYPMSGGE